MGFSFRGIFTNTKNEAVIAAVIQRWPFCFIKNVEDPFNGIMVSRKSETDPKLYIREFDEKQRFETELPEFSTQFPGITFIYLWSDGHGGDCYYDGYACRNGQILIDNRGEGPDKFSRHFETEKLRAVVEALDVSIAGYFAPFEREFLENEENTIYPAAG